MERGSIYAVSARTRDRAQGCLDASWAWAGLGRFREPFREYPVCPIQDRQVARTVGPPRRERFIAVTVSRRGFRTIGAIVTPASSAYRFSRKSGYGAPPLAPSGRVPRWREGPEMTRVTTTELARYLRYAEAAWTFVGG